MLILRSRAAAEADAHPTPPGLDDLVGLLDAPVVWVGEYDEILAASPRALSLGIVRGNRVTSVPLLTAIREARMSGEASDVQIGLNRGLGLSVELVVHVEPNSDQSVFIVAADKANEERVNVAAQDFVANTSHELKTPVGAIALLAEALSENPDDPETVAKFSGSILRETRRLTELAAQLIALSRLQSADPMLSARDMPVTELVDGVVDRLRPLADQREVAVAVAGDRDLIVHGDAEQLVTALSNLVHNAIVYSAPKARVTVSTRSALRDGLDVVELAVTDTGIGIAEEDQDRVFERFYRVDYARSRESGGTGLGLPIVRHVAQAHGGDVAVWSQLGRGSTFTITIPSPVGGPA